MNKNRLMVYVRVKPEPDIPESSIDVVDDQTLIFDPIDPEKESADVHYHHGKQFKVIGFRRNKNKQYTFDRVFDFRHTNSHIYETVTRPMVDATIDGYNCSVFAYGATGSGKTYTILGKHDKPGVIYFTMRDLFSKLSDISQTDPLPADLKICYFEIYNEKIKDLLAFEATHYIPCGNKRLRTTPERCRVRPAGAVKDAYNLPVCEAPGQSLVIPDLTYHSPKNADRLLELLKLGNTNRKQDATNANSESSRSHAIFQIVLTRRKRRLHNNNNGSEYELQTSKMSLIDLAGSERASVAYRNDRSKVLQREGGNINKSLLALGNCINALADPKNNHKHIPYRNSKLTRLLRDSLEGRCKTAMIATVCQQLSHYDDTQNTLNYASRAICIKTQPTRNFTEVSINPKNYSIVIDNQGKRIAELERRLEEKNNKFTEQHQALQHAYNELKKKLEEKDRKNERHHDLNQTYSASEKHMAPSIFFDKSSYGLQLETLYNDRATMRRSILEYESKCHINELKRVFKKVDEDRQEILGTKKTNDGSAKFLQSQGSQNSDTSDALDTQLRYYEQELSSLRELISANKKQIDNIVSKMSSEFVMRGFGTAQEFNVLIKHYKDSKEQSQSYDGKCIKEQHAYDMAQFIMNRLIAYKDLLNETAKVTRHVYNYEKGRSIKSESIVGKLANHIKLLSGTKNVVWKDDKYEMENTKVDELISKLSSLHDNFSLDMLTPSSNNKTLRSRRLSKNLVAENSYTPEQINTTFDASH